ncbi:4-(cytidine 5'-diphospho)-2-C-methyl-D-erythritol kinase [Paraclostridium sordellii]|uniref:4-(cytidine 5'-diphospho)-2-C-methyl-D-erythritol kinase n=1 Tax=Paraclostridium sordellii TaxID=1505 RepID=UPI00038624AD|nr:4-(cytidine 5'-diphospho)-2-C-methyl-D-erythritol kinase [Paeniclostridium sordellii]MDU5019778.1 4-(cytidine 5'-diphospho)-2-C-methyl-D-erythritol kinase [Clostridiales bacterium]AUN15843.1 4-(cytidine 5'-diphospho)-2-C-methyl-D-erythritol kinase [Paeniclostridium sordellii]EPZ54295.1 4-(cytidine 5'-diphospho)-2-C-methyl-D-erythritol kinase [[Clostridium] sordellii VPI 9048] [Paeniclostridium sordellii VPI 9048]MBS6024884.1 4-(cytidine 5'-diphospho)-2-C-methyl-D-erythritol kinase [Paeniclos
MNSIGLKSRAKINLSIDVLGKRQDGYHIVEMIMQTIDLYDNLKITQIEEDSIKIKSNSQDIPLNQDNIVYKAANILKEKFNIKKGIEISIQKNIPVAAGMAGGSSNAAAVLVGLNRIWDLGLNQLELKDIALQLGADVPFCITGGSALAQGIGEELTDIKGLNENIHILICKPNIFVSTKEVYQSLDMNEIKKRPDNQKLIDALQVNDVKYVSENMVNVLEEVTSSKYNEINQIERIIMDNKALGSMMSGSGPTVFGLFDNKEYAIRAKEELLQNYNQVYLVKSSDKGVEING